MSTTSPASATSREVALMKDRIEAQMGRQRTQLERQATYARACITDNKTMKPLDVVQMAKNLHTLIGEACAAGLAGGGRLTKAAIANAAGKMDGNGRSGALERFTRNPASEDKAVGRLTQRPAGYLALAESAARLAGIDADRTVVALVQGTRLAQGMDTLGEDTEADHLVMLANAIQGETRRIAKAANLSWYFDTIARHDLVLNGDRWEADYDSLQWQWQTLPQVALTTEEVAVFGALWRPKLKDGGYGEEQRRAAWVCRRIGLALAPFGPGKEVRAYVVRRPALVIARMPNEPKRTVAEGGSLFSGLVSQNAMVVGMPDSSGEIHTNHGIVIVDPQSVRTVPLCEASDHPGDDHEFIEVTPASLASVLESGFPTATGVFSDYLSLPKAAFTKSPPGSRAASLEQALLHGQFNGEGGPLMVELAERALKRVGSLRAWVDDQTASIEEALTRMAASAADNGD